jgi:hypothetical protein
MFHYKAVKHPAIGVSPWKSQGPKARLTSSFISFTTSDARWQLNTPTALGMIYTTHKSGDWWWLGVFDSGFTTWDDFASLKLEICQNLAEWKRPLPMFKWSYWKATAFSKWSDTIDFPARIRTFPWSTFCSSEISDSQANHVLHRSSTPHGPETLRG